MLYQLSYSRLYLRGLVAQKYGGRVKPAPCRARPLVAARAPTFAPMSSPLRISPAKANAATAAQLADFGRQTFSSTFSATTRPEDMAAYLAATFTPDVQLADLRDPNTTVLLAQMQGQLVGYAKLRDNSALGLPEILAADPAEAAGRLEIAALYVAEDWIGTGLGAALMRATLALAEQLPCTAVVLGVWEKNDRALAFYKRFAFKEIGEHGFQMGATIDRDLILRKGLAGRAN